MRRLGVFQAARGFTLIELLCVIAIIAILAGLLMSSMGSIHEKGDGLKCSQNLRQIGAAVQSFVGQNDGMFPEIETDPGKPVYTDSEPDAKPKGLLETLAPFGITPDSVKCPADVRDPKHNWFAKRGTSYEWIPYADDELETAPVLISRRGQIVVPPSKIMICTDTDQVHGLQGNYKSKKNYLYADGHIRNYWDTAPRARPK